ncbi:MAG TPA: sugar phosphate isomerase/epimerase, partial [Mariniphaga anaerophila]|nr:sugar phosphate isomerase/epimerase [Mariniphaga anaerophila]
MTVRILFFTAIAAFLAQAFVGCSPEPKEKYIGLQLYSLRDDMRKDVPGTVVKVGEMGYKFVEAAGYGDGKFYGMEPTEFKALCETNG